MKDLEYKPVDPQFQVNETGDCLEKSEKEVAISPHG